MVEQLRDEGSRVQVLVAASTAGLVSRFVIAPLDVIKVGIFHKHAIVTYFILDSSPTTDTFSFGSP
jgi:hypothetical protein